MSTENLNTENLDILEQEKKNVDRLLSMNYLTPDNATFAATPGVNNGYVKHILPKWTSIRTDLLYRLSVINIQSILEQLRVGLIDFAIVDGNFPKKQYNSKLLCKTKLVLAVNKKHRLAKFNSVSISDLQDERIILDITGGSKRDFLENDLKIYNKYYVY